jgi:broad specificity phosphatase PhoE
MPTTRILLVRHGQSTWNAQGKWQGRADPPLSPLGQHQAAQAGTKLGMVDAVLSSPLVRAFQTASIIAEAIGIGPVATDDRLIETDAGDWTGLTFHEIRTGWPGWLDHHRFPENFEKQDDIVARMTGAMWDIAAMHPGGTVVAVTHSGAMRNLDRSLGDTDPSIPNLAARWYDVGQSAIVGGERLLLIDAEHATSTSTSQV